MDISNATVIGNIINHQSLSMLYVGVDGEGNILTHWSLGDLKEILGK